MAAMIAGNTGMATYVQASYLDVRTTHISTFSSSGQKYRVAVDEHQGQLINKNVNAVLPDGLAFAERHAVLDRQAEWKSGRGEGNKTATGKIYALSQSRDDYMTDHFSGNSLATIATGGIIFAGNVSETPHTENTMQMRTPIYPASLLTEYDQLTDKKYSDRLSVREIKRLQTLKEQMDTIDRSSPIVQSQVKQLNQVYASLSALDGDIKKILKERRKTANDHQKFKAE